VATQNTNSANPIVRFVRDDYQDAFCDSYLGVMTESAKQGVKDGGARAKKELRATIPTDPKNFLSMVQRRTGCVLPETEETVNVSSGNGVAESA